MYTYSHTLSLRDALPSGHSRRKAQRLGDLAMRAAGAIMDDGGGNARAVAAIARIDILHHLLAPLVLEIDVDVGRLAAILGHEAREEQVMLQGVDRRDAKQEADDRIGGRSASLRSEEHTLNSSH